MGRLRKYWRITWSLETAGGRVWPNVIRESKTRADEMVECVRTDPMEPDSEIKVEVIWRYDR
jgi:hypothetical protein